jgi:uncharacterized protein (UPF0305 family)
MDYLLVNKSNEIKEKGCDNHRESSKVTNEFNDMANLRNAIRHSREADQITKMKGEASFLWFKQQLN